MILELLGSPTTRTTLPVFQRSILPPSPDKTQSHDVLTFCSPFQFCSLSPFAHPFCSPFPFVHPSHSFSWYHIPYHPSVRISPLQPQALPSLSSAPFSLSSTILDPPRPHPTLPLEGGKKKKKREKKKPNQTHHSMPSRRLHSSSVYNSPH